MKISRKPEWLNKKIDFRAHQEMSVMLKGFKLNTICSEAACPNISECFSCGRATFLIMGTKCTRECSFCNVSKEKPGELDKEEPANVAEAVKKLGLAHVVITSPTRDDLCDYGAGHFAYTVKAVREVSPETRVELLVPDFRGDLKSLETVAEVKPDIFGHNLETVSRLYHIRKGADYQLSLKLLKNASEMGMLTKSGIMAGLGEKEDEVAELMDDLREAGVDYFSIGQYLQPSRNHYDVAEFVRPEIFDRYKTLAIEKGFKHVESAPYVRSSYMAEEYK
ncbi:MAG: lipoyl synthase [Denitrovibrio sp.]|nr:MAG: lipoyl synthase [Denitrovibrio sp.]